jgi:spore maturation protein CgeB
MRIAMFYHSLISDWNHGNAHFLRGIASELQAREHELLIFEPRDSWSRVNLIQDYGSQAANAFQSAFPRLSSIQYDLDSFDPDISLDQTDLIIVHEWNDQKLIATAGDYRRRNPSVRLLFHDTHHRALTAHHELASFDLSNYDGVLAYGASLQDVYRRHGWGRQVHVWHEAADTSTFYPRHCDTKAGDVVWIGNWGDEERTEELREYFVAPVKQLSLAARVYGVRYPQSARDELSRAGIEYGGWLPNFQVPDVFARFKATVHVPRRPYARELSGIPTIRPFEALACGIPLISAPWQDTEGLFRIGKDFLMARNGDEMQKHLKSVLQDPPFAAELARNGLETIRKRHTCAHRTNELLAIYDAMKPPTQEQNQLAAAGVEA